MDYLIIVLLVSLSGLFSGLTLGFFTLDTSDLKRKADLGDKKAKKILPIRKNGNLLLCTLLVGNAATNSALSIYLGSIAPGLIAGLIATALIVVFGEIIPQASFSRYALTVGSKLSWLVKFFIAIFYIVCKPMSLILNKALGEEIPTIYSKHELIKIVEEHEDSKISDIDADEEKIIRGALSFSNKTVSDIMTPRTQIFSFSHNQKITKKILHEIIEVGHSRIPVYKNKVDNIVGILYVKDMISHNYKNKTAKDLARKKVLFVDYNKPLDDLLAAFRKTRNHLFVVLGEYGNVTGIVTIEDVIEEIIGEEIVDEYDQYEDLRKVARDKAQKRKIEKV